MKNRANDVRALITAFQSGQVQKAFKASAESMGTAIEEQDRWMDSIEAKKNRIAANFEELGDIVFSSEKQKTVLDAVDNITAKIVKIFDMLGTFPTLITAIGTAIAASKLFSAGDSSVVKSMSAPINAQIVSLTQAEGKMRAYNAASESMRQSLSRINAAVNVNKNTWQLYIATLNGAEATMEGYTAFLNMNAKGFFNARKAILQYNNAVRQGNGAQATMIAAIRQTNPELAKYLIGLNGAKASMARYSVEAVRATAAQKALNLAMNVGSALKTMGISLLISGAMVLVNKWVESAKEAREATKKLTEEINVQTESFKTLKEEYEQIINSYEDEATKKEKLSAFNKKLIEDYGIEAEKIEDVNKKRKTMLELIDEEDNSKRLKYLEDTQAEYEKIIKKFGKINDDDEFKIDFGIKDNKDVSDKIQSLFNGYRTFSETTGFMKNNYGFLGIDAKDNLEYLERLKTIRDELYKMNEKEPLMGTDKSVYKAVEKELKRVEKIVNEDSLDIFETYNRQKVQQLYQTYIDEGNAKLEDVWGTNAFTSWMDGLTKLIELQPGAEYLKGAMDDLFNSMVRAKDESPTSKELSDLDQAAIYLENIGLSIGKLSKEIEDGSAEKKIKDIADAFEALDTVISNNASKDKYFSAKEIIELIDQYPELADAIQQTVYGYKIEEDALKQLKQVKLDEQKTTLQAQLDETVALYAKTQERLRAYESEVKGIKSVADAKTRLAELEMEIARVQSAGATGGLSATRKRVREERKLTKEQQDLNSYIQSSELYEQYGKAIESLQFEIDILGTGFEDATDSAKDLKDELSAAKDQVKEMQDDLKDGQKAIQDLVELTMNMIRKQKQLEKESYQNRIDAYKEAVALKKKELELEKDIKKFSDELSDKNKSVTKIQTELDALSVEGVNYSLEDIRRRKELEDELVEKKKERDDFLYEHEVDVRKDALDQEADDFEKSMKNEIASIDQYLSMEGQIRRNAIELINGATQEFYNDLSDYTRTFTSMSDFEFNKLWNSAYDALRKYGNGVIDVEYTLAYLDGMLQSLDNQLAQIESRASSVKNSTGEMFDEAIQKSEVHKKTLDEILARYNAINNAANSSNTTHSYWSDPYATKSNPIKNFTSNPIMEYLGKLTYHSGGVVGGNLKGDEVVAKLQRGEVVLTPKQISNLLMNKTMTNLFPDGKTQSNTNTTQPFNNSIVINVNGNADDNTIDKIRKAAEDAVNSALGKSAIQNQKFRTVVR